MLLCVVDLPFCVYVFYVANVPIFFEVLSYGLCRERGGWDGRGELKP